MGCAGLLLGLLQAAAWTAAPAAPTVGDTIRLQRFVAAPTGWRVRPAKLEPQRFLDPLAEPAVLRSPGGWMVRYPVVAWNPGSYRSSMPPVLVLGPGGQVDSIPGDTAAFYVSSVLGDSAATAKPRAALAPLRADGRNPLPVAAALTLAVALLIAGGAFRRRGPRTLAPPPGVPVDPAMADARWVAAGEPRAVAARAAQRLRAAVARAVPDAHQALSTPEFLAVVARARPDAPLGDLTAVLTALDQVEFAAAHGSDVGALALRAQHLSRTLGA